MVVKNIVANNYHPSKPVIVDLTLSSKDFDIEEVEVQGDNTPEYLTSYPIASRVNLHLIFIFMNTDLYDKHRFYNFLSRCMLSFSRCQIKINFFYCLKYLIFHYLYVYEDVSCLKAYQNLRFLDL